MASTFQSVEVAAGLPARWIPSQVMAATATREIAAALVVNDVIQMVTVPKGAVILEVILATDDLDTDGTPAIVLDVGITGGDTDRFIDGATTGQAGGFARMNNIAGFGYEMTATDTIDILVETAPDAGTTSGTIQLTVIYYCGSN